MWFSFVGNGTYVYVCVFVCVQCESVRTFESSKSKKKLQKFFSIFF